MDFKKFYEDQKDYSAFRTSDEKRNEYELIVRWKTEQLLKLVPPGLYFKNILEVGCAMGILLNNLAEKLSIKNIYGLDISDKNIQTAKDLFPQSIFYCGTIEDLKLLISRKQTLPLFDLVILSDIIEHIPDDSGFLKSVRDISSYVMINLPLEKCLRNRHRQYGEDDPSGHLRWYDRGMALSLINQAGFSIISGFTANSLKNKDIFRIHKKARMQRIRQKQLPKKLFWLSYYFAEDIIRISSSYLYEKIHGTNYFLLLKSR